MFVCLKTVRRLIHSRNALGHHCVCMNTFFSLTPGCFRFLGVFILFVCLFRRRLAHELQSFHSHGRSVGRLRGSHPGCGAWLGGIHLFLRSSLLRVTGRGGGMGVSPLEGKDCRALKISEWRCVPSIFFFSLIVRARASPEITKGIYFYFKIGNMACLFNKKLVLPIARWPSLSSLPLMTNYANSGSLVNSMCAGPCPRDGGAGAGGRKT